MTDSDGRTCGAHRGFDAQKQFVYAGPPPYFSCDEPATHVEIEGDMRVWLCTPHAEMWSRHDPSWLIVRCEHLAAQEAKRAR